MYVRSEAVVVVVACRLSVNKKAAAAAATKGRKSTKKDKKAKDPNKPKRPPSAFFVFM